MQEWRGMLGAQPEVFVYCARLHELDFRPLLLPEKAEMEDKPYEAPGEGSLQAI